jgi:hypothetical protein
VIQKIDNKSKIFYSIKPEDPPLLVITCGVRDDETAIKLVLDQLKEFLSIKNKDFNANKTETSKKIINALSRLFHPFTLVAIAYMTGLLLNNVWLIR